MICLSLSMNGCDFGDDRPLSVAQTNAEANASIAEVEAVEETERFEEEMTDGKAQASNK